MAKVIKSSTWNIRLVHRLKWSLALYIGVLMGLAASPLILMVYLIRANKIALVSTYQHLVGYMRGVKYDCLKHLSREIR